MLQGFYSQKDHWNQPQQGDLNYVKPIVYKAGKQKNIHVSALIEMIVKENYIKQFLLYCEELIEIFLILKNKA